MTSELYVDFDETLFDHLAFMNWVDEFMGVGAVPMLKTVWNYHSYSNGQRPYDHNRHLRDHHGVEWPDIRENIEKNCAADDFLYPDARNFLTRHKDAINAILTFGSHEYQTLKTDLVLRAIGMTDVVVIVVQEDKNMFIAERICAGAACVVLVDDKAQHLPDGAYHVWVDRTLSTGVATIQKGTASVVKTADLGGYEQAMQTLGLTVM